MDTPTLYNKLSSVPGAIKTWLGSDAAISMIDGLEGRFVLPGGSASIIAKLIQRIQIKDLLPEYFSGELASELGLEKNKATHITEEIKKNIFAPIKKDCSGYGIDIDLLDKFQMPPAKQLVMDSSKIPNDIIPAPVAPKPTILSDVGWSKMPVSAIKTTTPAPAQTPTSATIPTPKPVPMPTPAKPIPAPTASIPTPKPGPAPKPAIPEPAPVILHEDTAFKPPEKNAGFTLAKPQGGADMNLGGKSAAQAPIRPAVLEFGTASGMNKPMPKPVAPPPTPPTPAAFKTAPAAPRNISQITGAPIAAAQPITPPAPAMPVPPKPPMPPRAPSAMQIPQPPKPPAPSPTPKPPVPSSQNADKAIVKDFL